MKNKFERCTTKFTISNLQCILCSILLKNQKIVDAQNVIIVKISIKTFEIVSV